VRYADYWQGGNLALPAFCVKKWTAHLKNVAQSFPQEYILNMDFYPHSFVKMLVTCNSTWDS